MYLVVSIIMFFICILRKKSKVVFFLSLIWIWFLMSFSTGLADDFTNYNRYYNYLSMVGRTELGYYVLMKVFVGLGISFDVYKRIIAIVELVLISVAIVRLTKNINVPIAFYMIFPFCMDVVQMRNTLGLSITVFGFQYLCLDDGLKKYKNLTINEIKFICCVLVASLFHSLNLIYLILLLGNHLRVQKTVIITFLMCGLGVVLIKPRTLVLIGEKIGIGLKIASAIEVSSSVHSNLYKITLVRVVVYLSLFLALYIYSNKKKYKYMGSMEGTLILNSNILMLIIIPLMEYAVDFYRCQVGLSILNYIYFSKFFFDERNGKISRTNIVLTCILFVWSFLNLYLLVLSNNNIYTVFYPIFFGDKSL